MSLSSAKKQFSGDIDKSMDVSTLSHDPVPQQLKEIIELMSSINRRLEDCAVEWQSNVSRKQWRILDGKSESDKSWEQTLLARTYFTDKSLDEAFQCLLMKDKTFTEQLNNFVAMLRGDDTSLITLNVRDAQNQCPDLQSADSHSNRYPIVSPLDLSVLEDRGRVRKTRKSKRLASGKVITTIQQSFGDLVKAKINLDTKFLGFEALLSGSNQVPRDSESRSCLCQICTNVLGDAVEKGNVIKSLASVRQKVQRVTRAQSKRLGKTARPWNRRKAKNQTLTLNEINEQSSMVTAKSYRESIAD